MVTRGLTDEEADVHGTHPVPGTALSTVHIALRGGSDHIPSTGGSEESGSESMAARPLRGSRLHSSY